MNQLRVIGREELVEVSCGATHENTFSVHSNKGKKPKSLYRAYSSFSPRMNFIT